MPTLQIPDSSRVDIGRNAKYGQVTVDWTRVPLPVIAHIWETYSAQYITDSSNSGGTNATGNERMALAQRKLDQMYAGELRARRGESAEPADPVEAEAYKLAKAALTEKFTEAGYFRSVPKGTKDRLLFVVNKYREEHGSAPLASSTEAAQRYLDSGKEGDAVRKQAARNVKERQAASANVNLEELGL